MAFPVVFQGPEGEQYSDYAAPAAGQAPAEAVFGQKMVLLDGTAYRFHKVGASTLVVGNVVDGPANITNHIGLTSLANALGATTLQVTTAATAVTVDQYKGGYANVVLTPGGGELYRFENQWNIQTNAAVVAGGGTFTGTLLTIIGNGQAGIRTALTATSRVDLILNPYSGTIQSPITTLTSHVIGIAVKASTTGRFGWIQTRGIASVLVSGTPVIGNRAVRLVAAAAAAGPAAVATSVEIGRVNSVGSTWMTVDLTLDG